MNYPQIIDRAVREAAEQGLTAGDIIQPLLNMAATTLANVVVEHRLDAAEEIDTNTRIFENLYEQYLDAYNKQTA